MTTSGATNGGNRTIKKYIEYPVGVFHQVLWSGVLSKSITGASGTSKSDVLLSSVTGLPLVIAAGDVFYERTVNLNATVASFPVSVTPAGADVLGLPDGNVSGLDLGNSGDIVPSTGVNTFGAAAIIGKIAAPNARSFVIIGDSIAFGQGDVSSVGAKGGSGWIARMLDHLGFSYVKIAMPGQQASELAASFASPAALLAQCSFSDAIFEHGVNDLRLSRTKAQILADLQTLYALAGNARICQTTITPRSDTTDSYATIVNQTPKTDGNMADLTPLNTDIRAGTANVDFVLEAADAAMSVRNSNIWGGPFPPTLDGTHPTSAKAAAMALSLSGSI